MCGQKNSKDEFTIVLSVVLILFFMIFHILIPLNVSVCPYFYRLIHVSPLDKYKEKVD